MEPAVEPVGVLNSGSKTLVGAAAAVALGQKACAHGVWVSNPLTNTAAIYIGGSGVTATTGIELQPGDREFVRCHDAGDVFAFSTGSLTFAWVAE